MWEEAVPLILRGLPNLMRQLCWSMRRAILWIYLNYSVDNPLLNFLNVFVPILYILLILCRANPLFRKKCKTIGFFLNWLDLLIFGICLITKVPWRAVATLEHWVIAAQTLMCVGNEKPEEIINRIAIHRDSFYRELSTFDTFGRGWLRRNDVTREQALAMARG